jgi:hypothetical protein
MSMKPDTEPTIVTAPGQAPEARYAEKQALDSALDDITGMMNCDECGGRHRATFTFNGRERGWHEQLEDTPRKIVARGRR